MSTCIRSLRETLHLGCLVNRGLSKKVFLPTLSDNPILSVCCTKRARHSYVKWHRHRLYVKDSMSDTPPQLFCVTSSPPFSLHQTAPSIFSSVNTQCSLLRSNLFVDPSALSTSEFRQQISTLDPVSICSTSHCQPTPQQQCTSVLRKRRKKMTKHKYKKLRKKLRFLRRKLKK